MLTVVQAELNSLHGVTMDSTKLLTEKLALARELSSLRPELEHLRSQAASHQSLLAEKLSLERQVSTLQVELENEKRSVHRTMAKESKAKAEDVKLESRVETLQADLAKERRERQKADRDAQKTSTEWENKVTTLESRLDAFRTKLKSTKEQLKESQTELQSARAANNRPAAKEIRPASTAANPRKRGTAQMDADTMIGTPGDVPPMKRAKKGPTMVGEKSFFSITPFLNRTTSVAPESPSAVGSGNEDDESEDTPARSKEILIKSKAPRIGAVPTTAEKPAEKPNRNAQQTFPSGLENAKTTKAKPGPVPPRKLKAVPRLEQVAEEDGIEAATAQAGATASKTRVESAQNNQTEIKKRKRKVLGGVPGKTLFDEEDGEQASTARGFGGGRRGIDAFGKGRLGAPRLGTAKAMSSAGSFGAFSPLKKDR